MSHKPDQSETDLPNIGGPASRALAAEGITHLSELTTWREADLSKLHGMGPKAMGILRGALADRGLSFAAALDHTH